jgi:outer membrane protein insertion porin family
MNDRIKKNTVLFLLIFFLISTISLFAENYTQIAQIDFKGTISLDKKNLLKVCNLVIGQRYYPSQIPKAIGTIEQYFAQNGYLFSLIDSVQTNFFKDSVMVNIVFWINSGKQTMWGDISLKSDSLNVEYYNEFIHDFKNRPYSEARLEASITKILEAAADSGYFFAQADVGKIILRKEEKNNYADINIHIKENHLTYFNNIIFDGNKNTRDYVLQRELNINKGMLYRKNELDEAVKMLKNMSILRSVEAPNIFKGRGDSVDVLIKVEESNATNFDGVIGYMPADPNDENSDGYFTGMVDISFNNLFGTARSFAVNWKKADTLSEEFHVRYVEPWIFDLPLNLALGLDRTVRDTLYIEWNYNFSLHMNLLRSVIVFTEVRKRSVIPDSAASYNNRLTSNDITDLQFGFQYDTRDYRLNPMSGLFYKASITYLLKKVNGPAYIIEEDKLQVRNDLQSYEMYFEWYQNIWKNQVFSLKLSGMHISGNSIQISDYFWFGGFKTIRGYRENQFSADKVAWANLEYRFLLGRNSRIFLFNDWGFFDNPQSGSSLLAGYGMGVRFETGLGILEVAYGLGKGDGFSEGKIHFGIINNF